MLKFNNNHIFTGYLKQLLSSVNIPNCKIYTREFEQYLKAHGKEDPRIIESIDRVFYNKDFNHAPARINYLKNNEVFNYYWNFEDFNTSNVHGHNKLKWKKSSNFYYNPDKPVPGFTRALKSPGVTYDKTTHEYLGDYLRFLRDYHNVNLMSLYNCFNNNICTNLDLKIEAPDGSARIFKSNNSKYTIYAMPVKLFNDYTIAIDSYQGIELFCGFYNTKIDGSEAAKAFYRDTYVKVDRSVFNRPFLYDKLNIKNWLLNDKGEKQEPYKKDLESLSGDSQGTRLNCNKLTRQLLANKELDLKLFIKVPNTSKSSIVVLEGDYKSHNDAIIKFNVDKQPLVITGCSVGSKTFINGKSPEPSLYELSKWSNFYYDGCPDGKGNKDDELGIAVPTIEVFLDSNTNELNLWEQDATPPKYSEETGYCEIETAAELAYVIKNGGKTIIDVNGQSKEVKHYKIIKDLYINDPKKMNWPKGTRSGTYVIRTWLTSADTTPFSGTIEGCGHTIFGLYTNNVPEKEACGLIPAINSDGKTIIRDLGINYAVLTGSQVDPFIGKVTVPEVRTIPTVDTFEYQANKSILNFDKESQKHRDFGNFKPISKIQLLEFNDGESYPFADRLIEYLSNSAITPADAIPDNIQRAQKVMENNGHSFRIKGLWEDKMQKIIYDSLINSGPVVLSKETGKLVDLREGIQPRLGHTNRSTLYDILGYVDKDAEKWYASWTTTKDENKNPVCAVVEETIASADIYGKLYDI